MSTSTGSTFGTVSLQGCLRGIDAAMRAGNSQAAMQLAAEGAARGFAHPQLLTLAVHERLAAGDGETALGYAEAARELAPRDADVLNALGLSLVAVGRAREAVSVFDRGLRQAPGSAMLHFNKADALESLSELARARREYERALAIEPVYPEALARIASMAALSGDAKAARDYAERALKQNPREAAAALALVMADLEEKRFEDAIRRAGTLAQDPATRPVNRSIAQGLIGDAYDGLGKPAEAFAAYSASNATRKAWFQPVYEAPGIETASMRAARLTAYFRDAASKAWRADKDAPLFRPAPKSPLATHVFLVGFPRSGTTLLEQILASHGNVEAMEERDCFTRAFDDFVMAEGGLERLAGLSGTALDPWRKAYWKYAADGAFVPSCGVFIDKMPLNTVLLALVAKLFPRAKVLFALRDPRDVVLSCFRRRFGMSAQMYEFLTLEGTARYYDAVMTLGECYRDFLDLDTHVVRYEDVVADLEGETRRICTFLGLEWDEGMRGFAEKTRARDVNTPSAAQVARGLYTQGTGQWRAYRAQLAPVLPMLRPWCAKFGYEEE
jgi:tetratricopeptide (TPR) repeat protein